MTTHKLKIWPEYFQPIIESIKKFELRKNESNFKIGDELWLREWNPKTEKYTGRSAEVEITYILDGPLAIDGMCLMSIKLLAVTNENAGLKRSPTQVRNEK